MYKFYTIEGKKLINYKPQKEHYMAAMLRKIESYSDQLVTDIKIAEAGGQVTDGLKRYIYTEIKLLSHLHDAWDIKSPDIIYAGFDMIVFVDHILHFFTPREFMQMFPVRKEYDGEKYEIKDYFYTMDAAEKIGLDTRMEENATEFLFDFCNNDIDRYMATWTMIVNRMHQLNGGKDMVLEFPEELGVKPHTIHRDGNRFVDGETGERFEIKKPENKLKELFMVVK